MTNGSLFDSDSGARTDSLSAAQPHPRPRGEYAIEPITRSIDLEWAQTLCRTFRDELGAVHLGVLPSLVEKDIGRVRVARESDPRITPIIAAAVPTDLQRLHVGFAMLNQIEEEAKAHGQTIIQAICRFDLPSNRFWNAAGFVPCFVRSTDSARGKPAIVWRRPIAGADPDIFLRLEPLRPRAAGGRFLPRIIPGDGLFSPDPSSLKIASAERYSAQAWAIGELLSKGSLTAAESIAAAARRIDALKRPVQS
jgi:hypothetical protein